jgi:hypothetical protein
MGMSKDVSKALNFYVRKRSLEISDKKFRFVIDVGGKNVNK